MEGTNTAEDKDFYLLYVRIGGLIASALDLVLNGDWIDLKSETDATGV